MTQTTAKKVSPVRMQYILRLIFRCVALVFSVVAFFVYPQAFHIMEGNAFFTTLSPFHLLWALWMLDMFLQVIPTKNTVALGSQKVFAFRFRPGKTPIDYAALKKRIASANWGAVKVLVLWTLLVAVIGVLYFCHVIDRNWLLLFTVAFYVCDLICVLIWCPFRLIMGNRCCTTCRIFNWDHIMMFSPLIFVGGFFRTAHKFAKPFVSYIIAAFLIIGAGEALHHFPGLAAVNAFGFEHILLQLALFAAGAACYAVLTLIAFKNSCKNFEKIDL